MLAFRNFVFELKLKTLWPLFYGWGSTASRLQPLRGGSRPWSHPVVLNTGLLDWEYSALTTRPLLHTLLCTGFPLQISILFFPWEMPFCNIYYGFTFDTNQTCLKKCFLQIHCILKNFPVKFDLQYNV